MPHKRTYEYERNYFTNNFSDWASLNGFQKVFSPSTVDLPTGITENQYGWLDVPTSTEIVIPFVSVRPEENRILFWFSEKITTNSSTPLRLSLEQNTTWNADIGDFDPNGWFTNMGFTVSASKDHVFSGIAMIRTIPGEALRLRVFPVPGGDNDFYFRFIAFEIPMEEEPIPEP